MSGGNVDQEVLTNFFNQQENTLQIDVDEQFFEDPKTFKYLKCLIEVLGSNSSYMDVGESMSLQTLKEKNSAVRGLFQQSRAVADVVEEVVKFQHGALNNSVETMGGVISEYTRCSNDILVMRKSIDDIRVVLTAKKSGQVNLKQLWLKKKEQEERIRILDDIEKLADAPRRINQLLQRHCYLGAVLSLNSSIESMFNEDLVAIGGLTAAREELMEQKSRILENIVDQLRDSLLGLKLFEAKDEPATSVGGDSESVDTRSEMGSISVSVRSVPVKSMSKTTPSVAAGAVAGSSMTEWSMDLSEASVELEKSLYPDPRSSGTMFIRLLVRAVGSLGVEDDVERMLLEDAPQKLVKTIRALKAAEKARIGDCSGVTYDEQQFIFSGYIHKVLDAIYMSLRKLMYGLHLLRLSRNIRFGGSKTQWTANENTKKAVLEIGGATAAVLQRELEAHLVEAEVVAMSDTVKQTSKGIGEGDSLFHSDILDAEDSPEDMALDKMTVCNPSVRLVAPVYQDIVNFSKRIHKLFKEECSMSDSEIPPSRIVRTVESISANELMPIIQSHVSRNMNEIQANSSHFCPPQRGEAGNNMEVHQLDMDIINANSRLGKSSASSSVQTQNVCIAAVKCLSTVKPLLTYWYQLPQHSEAVVTIIDRAIRGFVSCARDELDNLSWKLHAADKAAIKNTLAGMQKDPFFNEYRRSVYGDNCANVDELLGLSQPMGQGTPQQSPSVRKSIRTSFSDSRDRPGANTAVAPATVASTGPSDSLSAGNLSAELDSWGDLWTLGAPSYPTSIDKISSDAFSVSTIAAISLGCDWLVREICSACMVVIRRARAHQKPSSLSAGMRPSFQQKGSIRQSFSGALAVAHDDSPAITALITTIHGAVRGLSAVSEEGLATLRGDAEAACFHYLHHLAHVKFSKGQVVSSVNSSPASNANSIREKETDNVITSFNKQLLFMQDIFASASTPEAFAVVVSPCCYLAPRIFMRCVRFLSGPVSPDGSGRLMRAVVACHQSVSMLLESSRLEPTACRRLQDRVTDGFDKVRRYISFMGATVKDLEMYMLNSPSEYSYKEYQTMWFLLKDPAKFATFEDAWSAVKAGTTLHK